MKYLILSLLLLTGCASFNSGGGAERLAITYATMKYVESSNQPAERAERVIAVAEEAKSFLDTGTASLDLLQAAVVERLPADLSAADRLLANALIQTIVAELQTRVGAGIIPPDQAYQVSTVLGIVIDAAEAYRGVR
jgi:hypothetical protein